MFSIRAYLANGNGRYLAKTKCMAQYWMTDATQFKQRPGLKGALLCLIFLCTSLIEHILCIRYISFTPLVFNSFCLYSINMFHNTVQKLSSFTVVPNEAQLISLSHTCWMSNFLAHHSALLY